MSSLVVPPALDPGDRIAVVAAAGGAAAVFPHVYELGLERLRAEFELVPVEFPTVEMDPQTLFDRPEARAEDLMSAFADPSIAGVIAPIGGEDQVRVLRHLDAAVIRANPTRFFGYSDNSAFASYLWRLGIASWQGPMIMTELAMQGGMFEFTTRYARRAFFEDAIGELAAPDAFTDADLPWDDPANLERSRPTEPATGHRFAGGEDRVAGPLYGGNLETLVGLWLADRGVPAIDELAGAILAIETSELLPPAWYCEFALLALGERGLLGAVDGVLVGRAKAQAHDKPREATERDAYRATQRETIASVIERYNPTAPVVFDVAFGHTGPTVPLPIGAPATIDPAAGVVRAD